MSVNWHQAATAHLRRIGELIDERDTWERYASLMEEEMHRLGQMIVFLDGSEADVTEDVLAELRAEAGLTPEMLGEIHD